MEILDKPYGFKPPSENGHEDPAALTTLTSVPVTEKRLHVAGTTHVDPIWMWDKQNGLGAFKATARSAVALANEFPDFTAAFSSASMFQYLEKVDPDTFDQVTDLVKAGRIEPVGGMWVEPDEYMASGPSFYRQLLEGQDYFAKKFGRTARTGWSPDAWGGRPRSLPAMLRDSEIEYLVYKRPEDHQVILPRFHRWASDNGEEVLVYHLHEYGTWRKGLPRHMQRVARDLREPNTVGLALYGAGNHGGGPTRDNLRQIEEFREHPELLLPKQVRESNGHSRIEVVHSLPETFFDEAMQFYDQIPVIQGDIPASTEGHYASHSGVKAEIRGAESDFYVAEAAASWRYMDEERDHRRVYPGAELRSAWRDLLFHQFHDTASGTSIPEAYVTVLRELARARATANEETMYALSAIANEIAIPTREGEERVTYPMVVFNLNGHEVEQFVRQNPADPEMAFQIDDLAKNDLLVDASNDITKTHMLIDETGEEVPFQRIIADAAPYAEIGFIAKVKPGFRTYRLVPKPKDYQARQVEGLTSTETSLENDNFCLEIDEETGAIKRLYDKQNDLDVTRGLAALPVVLQDKGDAWGQDAYDQPVDKAKYVPVTIERTHEGPLMSSIKVDYVLEIDGVKTDTTLSQEFVMYNDLPQIDVNVRSILNDPNIAVKLAFPLFMHTYPEMTHDTPYATSLRPVATPGQKQYEHPAQNWVDLTGESDYTSQGERVWHGLTIASPKYSYSGLYDQPNDQVTLNMLISRSGTYTSRPGNEEEVAHQKYLDVGEPQEFTYSMTPHMDTWRETATNRKGAELHRPLIVQPEAPHPGKREMSETFFAIDHDNVELGEVKKAENQDGVIVRLNEKFQQATPGVSVTMFGRTFELDFRPHDVKTVLIPLDKTAPILETNGLEIPIK